ncbi:hypothetical protein FAF44_11150 [Nonomuraea sp. MG754425]|uniref:DUF4190 domain-containing protein n=1 Tax=Nonomuraea sp. MG754425 TaxID=2570319 RepID=UPI001F48BA90|nr:DUF4190 domain-containing protein [Nonomuraea sp. MG754425]MCF6468939.1 hypothetical protein [Nonomuraea sp. MG754425]
MTTPGDPNEPREGQDPHTDRPRDEQPEGTPPRHGPEWWNEGTRPGDERPPEQSGPAGGAERPDEAPEPGPGEPGPREPGGEEPIAPAPPVVPRPDVPPTHEPRPAGEPTHPDLPTSPEAPEPAGDKGSEAGGEAGEAGGDAEATQVYPIPGGRPSYPGWGAGEQEEPPVRQPSRYEQPGEQPHFAPPAGSAPAGSTAFGAAQPPGEAQPPGAQPPAGGQPPLGGQPPAGAQPPAGEGEAPWERRTQDQEPTVPGTTPSAPYGGPPGYPPPPGAPYGGQPSQYGGQYGQYQQPVPGSGLATASLVLGVASPFLVFVCFTGLITAILSIVFGWVALAKHAGRGRAIAGIVISVLSLILFTIVAIWFWNVVQECAHLPGQLADRCFQDRFPWMSGTR